MTVNSINKAVNRLVLCVLCFPDNSALEISGRHGTLLFSSFSESHANEVITNTYIHTHTHKYISIHAYMPTYKCSNCTSIWAITLSEAFACFLLKGNPPPPSKEALHARFPWTSCDCSPSPRDLFPLFILHYVPLCQWLMLLAQVRNANTTVKPTEPIFKFFFSFYISQPRQHCTNR